MSILKKELLKICKSLGIPLVGFAPVERWQAPPEELPTKLSPWIPEEFWPQSIFPEARTVIVIGLPVALPIVETAPSIYYNELYKTVNSGEDTDSEGVEGKFYVSDLTSLTISLALNSDSKVPASLQ